MPVRSLVAGIGNIFLGDDGFGVEVVNRLQRAELPAHVSVADFGIRGVHLAFELAGGAYESVILVDTVARGQPPGTLYVIDPTTDPDCAGSDADAHSLTPGAVLAWLRRIGGDCGRITIVGCEPASLDETMGLSAPVAAAVDEAVRLVRELVTTERTTTSCA